MLTIFVMLTLNSVYKVILLAEQKWYEFYSFASRPSWISNSKDFILITIPAANCILQLRMKLIVFIRWYWVKYSSMKNEVKLHCCILIIISHSPAWMVVSVSCRPAAGWTGFHSSIKYEGSDSDSGLDYLFLLVHFCQKVKTYWNITLIKRLKPRNHCLGKIHEFTFTKH